MKSLPCDGIVRAQVGPRDENVATNDPTGKQLTLLSKLASIAEMIEQHRATILLLELERMQLTTKLSLTGYRAPMGVGK